jgi:hypothetical protein
VAVALALAAGCSGSIGGSGSSSNAPTRPGETTPGGAPSTGGSSPSTGGTTTPGGSSGGGVPSASGAACNNVVPGPSPLRRLTRAEYANTVRDLFGDAPDVAADFPAEERTHGFDNNATTRAVSDLLAERYFNAAGTLAEHAVTKLPTLLACDPGKDGEAACLDKFLDTFARRAWRRPLKADERQNLKQTFTDAKPANFGEGIGAVVQVLLVSPQFLYRVEEGVPVAGKGYRALTSHEVASRLSYLLWGSMPDADLMAAADADKLTDRTAVRAQAERMLKDPRAAKMVARFSDQWLHLEEIGGVDKDVDLFPSFTAEVRGPLREESQRLIDKVLWKGDGKLSSLLTSTTTFVNAPLAKFYGMTGVSGDEYREVPVDGQKRLGILGHAGLLAVLGVPDDSLTALVFRGAFVRERLFCQTIGDPPPNAQSENPPFTPTTTSREWSEARQAKANCGACHALMDPIGFGFENFDGIGAWRTTDHGKPVDARGKLTATDVDGDFSGVVELGQRLAGSEQVRDCMATQWFRYGYGAKRPTATLARSAPCARP